MSEIPFHRTRMGQRYYEVSIPALVQELTRLNGILERLVDRDGPGRATQPDAPAHEEGER